MAEAVLSVFLKLLSSHAIDKIIREVSLVKGVKQQVDNMKRNLRSIKAVLEDAENKRWDTDFATVKDWLENLEDDSYQMVNVLDEWNTLILKSEIEKEVVKQKKVRKFMLNSCFCFPKVNNLISHREVALKIEELDEKVTRTFDQIKLLSLVERNIGEGSTLDNTQVKRRRETTSVVIKTEIHGRDEDEAKLLEMLMSRGHGEGQLEVISILGMGGLGKTALAQVAFNNENVKSHFKRVWVCVSEPFDIIKIASAVVETLYRRSIDPDLDENLILKPNSIEQACDLISSLLAGSRPFLLVLDDVWNEYRSIWEPLETRLRNLDPVGSKVLVTTRNEAVAGAMRSHKRINLKELNFDQCKIIFEQNAFGENKTEEETEEFKDIIPVIVRRCKGLPLAAKTIGSLMHFKRSRKEWENVLSSKIWNIDHGTVKLRNHELFGPFLLSYLDLPCLDKRCFLHCSIFPKDYSLSKRQLIELWMSEGCINDENKGDEVFENLRMRSFFQDFEEQTDLYDDGIHVKCKMHDILHDFLQYLTERECKIIESYNINLNEEKLTLGEKTRHLTIKMESEAQFPDLELTQANEEILCTFLILKEGECFYLDTFKFTSLRYLRTLNLSNCGLVTLPENIGNLIHLRYLELSNNPLVELPDTICGLYNLQTLKMESGCESFQKLPEGIGKLVNLRYLFLWGCLGGNFEGLPKGISKLTSLQYLDWYKTPRDKTKCLTLRELTMMKCKLRVRRVVLNMDAFVNNEQGNEDKEVDLCTLKYLYEIVIYPRAYDRSYARNGYDVALELFKPHPEFKILKVRNSTWPTFSPTWMMSLKFLRQIEFYGAHRSGNPVVVPALGGLPALEALHFWNVKSLKRVGLELLGIKDDQSVLLGPIFPKLKVLIFTSMEPLEVWEGEAPASNPSLQIMPCLETLWFAYCDNIRVLPGYLRNVPLKVLCITNYNDNHLMTYCLGRQGNQWDKISHVENIIFNDDEYVKKDGHYLTERQIDGNFSSQHQKYFDMQ